MNYIGDEGHLIQMIDFISMSSDRNGPQLKRLREHCALVGFGQSALKALRISIV